MTLPEPPPPNAAPPSASNQTSFQLRRAIAGDLEGIDWIVRRFSPVLMANAEFRLKGELARYYPPEDLVADIWATTLPNLGRLRARDGHFTPVLLAFLSSVLVKRVLNTLRLMARRKRAGLSGDVDGGEPERQLGRLDGEARGVIAQAIRSEETVALRVALDGLSPKDRAILVLRKIEMLSAEEVGAELGMTAGAVRVRCLRALDRLRLSLPPDILHCLDGTAD